MKRKSSTKKGSRKVGHAPFRKRPLLSKALTRVVPEKLKETMRYSAQQIPRGLFSQDTEHCFVRMPQLVSVFCSAANTVTIQDENGNAPSGWTIGGVANYPPSNVPALQFGLSAQFAMSFVPDYQDFTNLFNEWKIHKVDVVISSGAGDSYSSDASLIPSLYHAIDYNDASTPTGLNTLKEYENCVETQLSAGHEVTRSFRPKPALNTYQGVTPAYGLPDQDSVWLDTATPATLHYALKAFCIGFSNDAANGYAFRIQTRYYFVCRRPK